ncbi:unnamed protein product [Urochloa humidicola]
MSTSSMSSSRTRGYLGVCSQRCHCGSGTSAWIAGTEANAGRLSVKCARERCAYWAWINDLPRILELTALPSRIVQNTVVITSLVKS